MDKITLPAQARAEFGKKLKNPRKLGQLPAIVYGQKKEPQAVYLNAHEFSKIYAKAGHNTLVEMKVDQDAADTVLIQAVAHDPVSGVLVHADLMRINMSQSIKTTVPLQFVGDAPAVFQDEGTLVTNKEEVEVETLPAKLPANIPVDISGLDSFEAAIHIRDLVAPEGVELLEDDEELVCKVEPPRSEEELEALDEAIVEEMSEEEGAESVDGEQKTEGGEEGEAGEQKSGDGKTEGDKKE